MVDCKIHKFSEGLEVSEEVTRTSQFYKEKIMKELHVYYRLVHYFCHSALYLLITTISPANSYTKKIQNSRNSFLGV